MKRLPHRFYQAAFTLIELLVVIAIIAILAGFLFPVMARISVTQAKTNARAELMQVATAIESYKSTYSFYPPDNPTNALLNPLYYELTGTLISNAPSTTYFVTLDGSHAISTNDMKLIYNVSGAANSSVSTQASDEGKVAHSFLKDVKPKQVGNMSTNGSSISGRLLLCSQGWSGKGDTQAPWRYRSTNPTNNPGSFDLWVDLYLANKTNRISNWSKEPQIVRDY